MITIDVEPFDKALMDEMQPLWDEHWKEVAVYKDNINLSINRDWYTEMYTAGLYIMVVVREEGKLIGYAGFTLITHPHYKDNIFSNMDVAFLLPEYRRGFTAIKMFKFAEQKLKELGADVIILRTKEHYNLGRLFEHLNYEKAEVAYFKYVGV